MDEQPRTGEPLSEVELYRAIVDNAPVGIVVYRLEQPNDPSSLRLMFANDEASNGQLHQVFVNLLVNAAQAIEDQGKIEVKTFRQAGLACVEIRDSGTGMEEKDLPRIFDAGFTTKPSGVGTGLGLAIVAKIVEDHRGQIEVESKLGQGTLFRIRLPLPAQGSETSVLSRTGCAFPPKR